MPRYHCVVCGKDHDGIPAFHADRPAMYWQVPEDRRETNVFLTSDSCVIGNQDFFICGCLDIPIVGTEDFFTWGVWVSLTKENFLVWQDNYEVPKRSHIGPFFGWLCSSLPYYPNTLGLKTHVHLRDNGIRPSIELEPTSHPLAVDQREGISVEKALGIAHEIQHDKT